MKKLNSEVKAYGLNVNKNKAVQQTKKNIRLYPKGRKELIILKKPYIVVYVGIFTARDYELRRGAIELMEVLGEGQFGDVHKGIYVDKVGSQ